MKYSMLSESWAKYLGEAKRKEWDSSHVCLIKGKKVLLVQRAHDDHWMPGRWSFAGGQIDEGENLESALVREVSEEVGLVVSKEDLHFLPAISYKLKHALYCCIKSSGTFKINANGVKEHEDGKWVEVSKIKDYDTVPDVKKVVDETFKVMNLT